MAAATVLENQVFIFDSSSTIGDLLLVANALRNAGQRPTLRLVKSYTGQLESVAVDVEGAAPSGEMAVGGVDEDDQPRHSAACDDGYPEDCPACYPEGS